MSVKKYLGAMTMLIENKVERLKAACPEVFGDSQTPPRKGAWECHIDETVIGDYLLVPCTSTKLVRSEAYWMNSPWTSFIERCQKGTYMIFSLRNRAGERKATLGLTLKDGGWCFDQCMGPSESEVLEETSVYLDDTCELRYEVFATELYYIAHEVVRLMNSEHCTIM